MQLNLQKLVQDKLKQLELGSLKSKIQKLKDVKVVGQSSQAKIKWKQLGNMVSKEFFSVINLKLNKILIFNLRYEDGSVIYRKEGLKIVCYNFCKKLYEAKEETLE